MPRVIARNSEYPFLVLDQIDESKQSGWVNGLIANPTFPHKYVGLRKDATQRS